MDRAATLLCHSRLVRFFLFNVIVILDSFVCDLLRHLTSAPRPPRGGRANGYATPCTRPKSSASSSYGGGYGGDCDDRFSAATYEAEVERFFFLWRRLRRRLRRRFSAATYEAEVERRRRLREVRRLGRRRTREPRRRPISLRAAARDGRHRLTLVTGPNLTKRTEHTVAVRLRLALRGELLRGPTDELAVAALTRRRGGHSYDSYDGSDGARHDDGDPSSCTTSPRRECRSARQGAFRDEHESYASAETYFRPRSGPVFTVFTRPLLDLAVAEPKPVM